MGTKGEHVNAGRIGDGKSTLLRLVAGATAPDDGTVAVGVSVKMGYFAQHVMDLLDGEDTVLDSLESSSIPPTTSTCDEGMATKEMLIGALSQDEGAMPAA
jgi:ATPase subunit of ABC transporter with duplicated ATPase domains